MTTRLVPLLREAGWSFVVTGFVGRLPPAMLPLGVTLYAHRQLGSFAAAGTLTAMIALGTAVGGPVLGRLADRTGQRPVGLAATVLCTAALAAFLVLCRPGAGLGGLMVVAALVGASNPQVGAMARARWAALLRQRPDRATAVSTAMGYEGAADEAVFVVGPVAVTLLAALHPLAGLVGALLLGLVAPLVFALHPTALPPGRAHDDARASVRWGPLVPLGFVCAGVGIVFGSASTAIAALLTASGQQGLVGIVYGAMGVGSAISGLAAARVLGRLSQRRRLVVCAVALCLVTPLFGYVTAPVAIAAVCFVSGLALAPVLIGAFALAEADTPLASLSTVMTAMGTTVVVGVAAGAAVAGQVIDRVSPAGALLLPGVGGLVVLVSVGVAVVTRRRRVTG